jgi:precorrin-6A synthase
MITLSLVGIATGNPDHLTRQAVRTLNAAEVILLPRKGADKAGLADLRRRMLAEVVTAPVRIAEYDVPHRAGEGDYLDAVADWHDGIALIWRDLLAAHLPQGGRAAAMVWGDPSLYDSSLRIAARVGGLAVEVVPGLSSLQLLTAAHGIALNAVGAPVVITTGRRLRAGGWPAGADTVAVMLDSGGAFNAIDPAGVAVWWGGCLGLPQQALVAGPLAEAAPRILAARARLRADLGWVMDIYLLRRGDDR